ncbi:MAG TPA: hypothetical protein VKG26_11180 [Bacteroidia bacterium]|nr:hypothetical protein [Bacteroidia bacterium]
MFIFFLLSCKKDKKDSIAPSIVCNSPTVGQHYNMFDTVVVNAQVSDNEHLSSVNVTLTDLNHTPLQASMPVPIQSAGFTFTLKYILTQYHLQTGTYLIQINADDGYNTSSYYQSIIITESPTLLWGYCTVLKTHPQTIIQFDTTQGPQYPISSIVLSQAYNGMKYGGYNQELFVNGKGLARPFQAFYLQQQAANQLIYSASATANQVDYTSLYTDGTNPYVGFLNSDVNSFTNTGNYSTSYRLNDINFYPYLFTKTSNYGIGVYKSKIASVPDKIASFTGFGAFNQSIALPAKFKAIAVFEKGVHQDSIYVLGNDTSTNQAQIYIYQPVENSFSLTSLTVSGNYGKMQSAVMVNNEYVLFSTPLGIYPVVNDNLNVALLNLNAQKLVYQPKQNRLTVATTTGYLNSYIVGTTSLTPVLGMHQSINMGDSIIDFEVITNK